MAEPKLDENIVLLIQSHEDHGTLKEEVGAASQAVLEEPEEILGTSNVVVATKSITTKSLTPRSITTDDIDPEEMLKNHYTTESENEKVWFQCKHCDDYKSNFNSTMRDHVNSKHMRIMLKCTHCEFETLRFKTLNFHRRSKHRLSAMSCLIEKCGFKTILVAKLRDHLVRKHALAREEAKLRIANSLSETAVDGTVANCDLDDELECQSGNPKRLKYSRTVWSKGYRRPRGPRKTDEERQYRILLTADGKPRGVQCLYCDFNTRLPSNIPGHVNAKHLGKQSKCPECSFSTFYPKNLAVHMKKLHGRSTRKCVIPDCKFRSIQDERMHIHLMEKHNCVYDEVKNAIYIDI